MGIAKGAAKVLLKEASRRPFEGRLLTLGRQDIWFSYESLQKMAMEFGVKLSDPGDITLSHKPIFAVRGYLSDDSFFRSLGFSESKVLDFSNYESAHYIFDLNSTEVTEHLLEAFDVIIDAGTVEHVFHIPNALNNIYKMLRQGGRIIHLSPSSNHIDHGFYMFSPTLFWDFYKANRFEISNFQVLRYTPLHNVDPWEISNYQPGCLKAVSFGGLDDRMYLIICIVTKTKDSTGNIVPQQGEYACNVWKTQIRPKEQKKTSETLRNILVKVAGKMDAIKRFPLLYKVLGLLAGFVLSSGERLRLVRRAKKGLGLKIVARY